MSKKKPDQEAKSVEETPASRAYCSDIPANASEKIVSFYTEDENAREQGGTIHYERREYLLDGELVGYRQFDHEGRLIIETPMKDMRKHGTEYTWYWYAPDCLSLSEPYENGKVHGTARQWTIGGELMGSYTLEHGTGYDVWRIQDEEDGLIYVSEIHALQDGKLHGFQYWLNRDQKTIVGERHWNEGFLHGIERHWTDDGQMADGYPKFYIDDREVPKNLYMEEQRRDESLPRYDKKDDINARHFPESLLARPVALEYSKKLNS
ncbi:MAG: hypothetical protein KDI90_10545 [Alphaproteobacteria bacterium]|nr:hypothetical protein [Alphaproteobacteria bacterium]MCB9975638.1 hypothetical protein [Rhodospirillales bacterium]